MKQELEKLLKLQEIDADLISLKQQLEEVPNQLRSDQHEYEASVNSLHDHQQRRKELEVERMELQLDIESVQARIDSLKQKQAQVKKNAEYQALTNEITQAQQNLSKSTLSLEQKTLAIQEFNGQFSHQQAAVEEEKKELLKKARDAKKPLKEIQDKIHRYYKIRNQMVKEIRPDVVELYSRLMKTRAPHAIVPANSNVCDGCHINLPPQVMGDILKGDHLVICENCARILYIADEPGQ